MIPSFAEITEIRKPEGESNRGEEACEAGRRSNPEGCEDIKCPKQSLRALLRSFRVRSLH